MWCNSCMSSSCPCLEDDRNTTSVEDEGFEDEIPETEKRMWLKENEAINYNQKD